MSIENTYATLAQITGICVAHGVKYAVLSPGSRSAPPALSFIRNGDITHFVIPDERVAAYTALGISRQSQTPVVLVCTSGTAALNYAPAVAEAFFCNVPLIVITADRPPEWIAQADNQSIFQENIYGKHVKASYNFPVDLSSEEGNWQAQRQMNEALLIAMEGRKGPVHINIPLREPLYMLNQDKILAKPKLILSHRVPFSPVFYSEIQGEMKKYKKILFLAGMMGPDSELIYALEQIQDLLLVADLCSNLHQVSGSIMHSDMICCFESGTALNSIAPDLVISMGGPVVSKQLKTFLRGKNIKEHWHVGEGLPAADTYGKLSKLVQANPSDFIKTLASFNFNKKYYTQWRSADEKYALSIHRGIKKLPYSESGTVYKILSALPERSILHLGNSLPIRHVTSLPKLDKVAELYGNRGTSGIDGSLSSAVGQSMVDDRNHIVILGDQSFMYDSNGLWNKYLRGNFKIIILNNYGGRIFESLPGASVQPELNEYFVTEQPLEFSHIAAHFGFSYSVVENDKQLTAALPAFFKESKKASILEIKFKKGVSLGEVKKRLSNPS